MQFPWRTQHAPAVQPLIERDSLPVPEEIAHPFQAWAESFFVTAVARSDDRLSDLLNRRTPVVVSRATAVPFDMAPGTSFSQPELVLDPFDLRVVIPGRPAGRLNGNPAARRIHKVHVPVRVDGDGYQAWGRIHLFAGTSPDTFIQASRALFVPITQARIVRGALALGDEESDVVLLNRYTIQRVTQLPRLD